MWNKKGAELVINQELVPWLIGFGVLAVMVVLYFIIVPKDNRALDFMKMLLRFGR